MNRAIEAGRKALQILRIKLPRNPQIGDYILQIMTSLWHRRGKRIDELNTIPETQDVRIKKVNEILVHLCEPTNIANSKLFAYIILKLGNCALQYGKTELSAIGFCGYAVFAVMRKDYAQAKAWEQVALKLSDAYKNTTVQAIVYFVLGAMVTPWIRQDDISIDYLKRSVNAALQIGNFHYYGYALTCIIEHKFILGYPLQDIMKDCREGYQHAVRMNHRILLKNILIYRRVINDLTGDAKPSDDETIPQEEWERMLQNDDVSKLADDYTRAYTAYTYGEYKKAIEIFENAKNRINIDKGFIISMECLFYYTLSITAVYPYMPGKERKRYRKIVRNSIRKMKIRYSGYEENRMTEMYLMEAESAKIEGSMNSGNIPIHSGGRSRRPHYRCKESGIGVGIGG